MDVTNIIKSMQDIMRKDAGVDGDAQRLSQIVWLIFLKIYDDKESEWELTEDNYESPIPEDLRWRNWAANDEGITGEELLEFINNELFPRLKDLKISEDSDPRGFMVKQVFEDNFNYMKSGTLIREVINVINKMDFNNQKERHLFNDIYEQLLKDLQSAGNAGEFYTPRAVTQFMVDIINPQLGEIILDPACGTGGFLVSSIKNMSEQVNSVEDRKILQDTVKGIEKKPLPHSLCITNLILHDVEVPNVRHDNSLTRPLRDYGAKDKVNLIITNPPFGGNEEDGVELNFPSEFRNKETADLFMALIMRLVKPKGRCAVVLPDGFLFGEGVKTNIKKKLLEDFNLHTIVRLPKGVFNPYTDIKTNLLFFEKGDSTKEIWYFEHPYPEGYKSYSKTKPIRIKEFDLEKEWWNNRKENKYAWKVNIEEIKKKNYNLDFKNPSKEEESINYDSKEIINILSKNFSDSKEVLNQIKKVRFE